MKKAVSLFIALSSILLLIGSAFICALFLLFEIAPDFSRLATIIATPWWVLFLLPLAAVVVWILLNFMRKPSKEAQA